MPEVITAGMATALDSGVQEWVYLFKMEFLTLTERICTADHDVTWDSQTWTGLGGVTAVGAWEESVDNAVLQTQLDLQVADPVRLEKLLSENEVEGRPISMWAGLLDRTTATPSLVPDPIHIYTRQMNSGPHDRIAKVWTLYGETKMVQRSRGGHRVRSDADQKRFAAALGEPNDEGMSEVASIFRRVVTWPKPNFRVYE